MDNHEARGNGVPVWIAFSAAIGACAAAFFAVRIVMAFAGPAQNPPGGSGVISVSGSSVGISGNLAVTGTISGNYTGTIAGGNVSAGTFGSNTGGGNYGFSGNLTVTGSVTAGSVCLSGVCNSSWATMGGFSHTYGSAGYNYGSGYEELPDGFIIEWGSVLPNGGCTTATYPLAFPNAALNVQVSTWQDTDRIVYTSSYDNSSATFCNNGTGAYANWMAIGY